jgi:hypothetical protein
MVEKGGEDTVKGIGRIERREERKRKKERGRWKGSGRKKGYKYWEQRERC